MLSHSLNHLTCSALLSTEQFEHCSFLLLLNVSLQTGRGDHSENPARVTEQVRPAGSIFQHPASTGDFQPLQHPQVH